MRTKVYEIPDDDVLMTFFGEDAPVRRLCDIGRDHGELIWEGEIDILPDVNDMLTLDGAEGVLNEYLIFGRFFHGDSNTATLVVHAPNYHQEDLQ